jgi:hypothetical protein
MFSLKIFTIHSWEYISRKWTCLVEIWITWFQKELAITQFQIPHMESQKELWKPDLNLVSQGCHHKKILNFTLRIRSQDPCISTKYFVIGPSKQDIKKSHKSILVPFRTTKDRHSCRSLFIGLADLFSQNWVLDTNSCDGPVTKNLLLMQGPWVQIQDLKFIIFSWWHPWEPRFKSGFHNSFWDVEVPDRISWMTLEIYNWNLGTGFG